jgi:uncharacterized protein (TIGR00251 family)
VIEARAGGVRIRIRVQPRASRTEVAEPYGDALRVRVAAPPVDGAANDELVRFLAKRLGVKQAAVRIVSGDGARSKLVEVEGIDETAARAALLG